MLNCCKFKTSWYKICKNFSIYKYIRKEFMSSSEDSNLTDIIYTKAARNGAIAGAIGGAISGIFAGIIIGLFVCCCYDSFMPKKKQGDVALYTYRSWCWSIMNSISIVLLFLQYLIYLIYGTMLRVYPIDVRRKKCFEFR